MRVQPETVALVFGLVAVIVMATMLRRRRMREKYAVLWVLVAGFVLGLGFFPEALTWAATLLGVAVPLNLLYFLGGLAALLICVQFSVEFVAARGAHPPPGRHRVGTLQPAERSGTGYRRCAAPHPAGLVN